MKLYQRILWVLAYTAMFVMLCLHFVYDRVRVWLGGEEQ